MQCASAKTQIRAKNSHLVGLQLAASGLRPSLIEIPLRSLDAILSAISVRYVNWCAVGRFNTTLRKNLRIEWTSQHTPDTKCPQ